MRHNIHIIVVEFKSCLMLSGKVERSRFCPRDINITKALVALVLLGGIALVQPIRYNEDIGNDKISHAFAQGPQGGNYTFGILASIQNNEK